MGGLTIGILSGLVVAAVGVAAVSLSTPLPPRSGEMAAEVQPEVVDDTVVVPVGEASAAEAPVMDEPVSEELMAGETEAEVAEGVVAEELVVAPEPAAEDPVAEAPVEEEPADASAPATEIPLPSGTEFNRPPPEPEAALPSAETAPSGSAPQAPTMAGDVTSPTFDTASAAQPAVGAVAPAGLSLAVDPSAAPARPAAAPAPATATGPAALNQPDASATPDVDTALLAPIEPEVVEEVVETEAVAPEVRVEVTTPETVVEEVVEAAPVAEVVVEAAPEAVSDTTPDPVPTSDPVVVPFQAPVFPTIGDGASQDVAALPQTPEAPADAVAALSTPVFPQTSSLPQMVADPDPVEEPVAEEAVPALDDGPQPAIRAFAAEFDASEERPLMAIVLIDEPDSRIELSTLTRFSFPVAFAIDPLHPDAATRAQMYRDAGFEVVILGSMFAEGATAADVEVALEAAENILPEAVAVLDTPDSRIQADRPVLDAVVQVLSETGHGLVAFPRGLNAAEQSANRVGVPGATVFRMLDDEDQRATVITRFLTRAAFTASQEGSVIVVGRTQPNTVTALFSWALGGRSEGVALAPLSATIERAAGQ